MSDFTSDFWGLYVAIITLVSILACGVFLKMLSSKKVAGSTDRDHGPRLGRRPAGVQQPAAALVDVAVLHDAWCSR
jgi:hypothetical protein